VHDPPFALSASCTLPICVGAGAPWIGSPPSQPNANQQKMKAMNAVTHDGNGLPVWAAENARRVAP